VVRSGIGVYTLRGFDDDDAAAVAVTAVVLLLLLLPVVGVIVDVASGNCKAVESRRLGIVIENGEVELEAAAAAAAAAATPAYPV